MPFSEAIQIALDSLKTNKLRSFLTVLGILIGVSSVVAVVAIMDGLDRYMGEQVLQLGGKSFSVMRIGFTTSRDQYLEWLKRKDITAHDLDAVRETCQACAEVGGMLSANRDVKHGRITQENVQVMGITENFTRIGSVRDLIVGRQLTADDVEHERPVAVIGSDLMEAFFGTTESLGKEILISGRAVKVIAVAEKKGSVFGSSQDNFIWIPISVYRKLFGARQSLTLQVEAKTMDLVETAQDQVRMALRVHRHLGLKRPDDFSIETGESIMDFYKSATRGVFVVTIVVTAISLLVGGIVVMNIMLVSVTERIREIGVRKALGARRTDILRQFLVEAVVLSLFGGALGVLGAAVFSKSLALILGRLMSADFSAPVRLWAVLAALLMSSAVGLVAGIYPASRAAALDPVTALRNE